MKKLTIFILLGIVFLVGCDMNAPKSYPPRQKSVTDKLLEEAYQDAEYSLIKYAVAKRGREDAKKYIRELPEVTRIGYYRWYWEKEWRTGTSKWENEGYESYKKWMEMMKEGGE